MTMVWVDLKPGEGGCQPILDFLTEILPDTRGFDGCQGLKVYIECNRNIYCILNL